MASNETKKAQLALKKFQELAEVHLAMLNKRKENIKRYQLSGDHRALTVEKSRADLVVKQLYDLVQQMFTWCSDLQADTWQWVQYQLRPLNSRVQSELSEFLKECDHDASTNDQIQSSPQIDTASSASKSSLQPWMIEEEINKSDHTVIESNIQIGQHQIFADTLEQKRMDAEMHRQLLSDILDLNEIMKEMNAVVRIQGETVDTIEGNINSALINVDTGESHLFKAMKSKAASYPIAGALIGAGACAGPVGVLIGLKVAVVAAIGGSALGAISGHYLRKKVIEDAADSHEMKPLCKTQVIDAKVNRMKTD